MTFARFANPGRFLRLSRTLLPFLTIGAVLCFILGLYFSLGASPKDYLQGESVRIMYVHVPAAWMGLFLYVLMASAAGIGLVVRHRLTDVFCVATAPVGAVFTAICLITGSIWGKPTWGTWWVWDARLSSVLVLFLLYCGYIVLRNSFDDDDKGSKASASLLLIGVINIPIIHFSVTWWNTLHQGASVIRRGGPSLAPEMLRPLLVMAVAYGLYASAIILLRMRTELFARRLQASLLRNESDG